MAAETIGAKDPEVILPRDSVPGCVIAGLLGLPLAGNVLSAGLIICSLWFVPQGADIHPQNLLWGMVLIAIGTGALGVPFTVFCTAMNPKTVKLLCVEATCFCASLTPYFLGMTLFDFIVSDHHLILRW